MAYNFLALLNDFTVEIILHDISDFQETMFLKLRNFETKRHNTKMILYNTLDAPFRKDSSLKYIMYCYINLHKYSQTWIDAKNRVE